MKTDRTCPQGPERTSLWLRWTSRFHWRPHLPQSNSWEPHRRFGRLFSGRTRPFSDRLRIGSLLSCSECSALSGPSTSRWTMIPGPLTASRAALARRLELGRLRTLRSLPENKKTLELRSISFAPLLEKLKALAADPKTQRPRTGDGHNDEQCAGQSDILGEMDHLHSPLLGVLHVPKIVHHRRNA
jgi:hypothetical protein